MSGRRPTSCKGFFGGRDFITRGQPYVVSPHVDENSSLFFFPSTILLFLLIPTYLAIWAAYETSSTAVTPPPPLSPSSLSKYAIIDFHPFTSLARRTPFFFFLLLLRHTGRIASSLLLLLLPFPTQFFTTLLLPRSLLRVS